MKSKIHNLEIDGEAVNVKQTNKTFRVVKSYRNTDGGLNWFNIFIGGSWSNLVWYVAVVLLLLGIYEYSTNINTLLDCFRIPNQLPICVEAFSPESLKPINPINP